MIAQYVNQDNRTWVQLLPEITPAINTRTIPSAVLDQFLGPPAQATSHAEDEDVKQIMKFYVFFQNDGRQNIVILRNRF